MIDLGNDILKGTTVRLPLNTNDATGQSITIATNGTAYAIVDGSTTEVTTGVSLSEDFDSVTGSHFIAVDTSQTGFTLGSEVLVGQKGMTVDGKTVNVFVGRFGIQMATAMKPVVGLAQGGGSAYVDLPSSASSTDGAYSGAIVRVKHATGALEVRAQSASTAYVGSSRRFTVDPAFVTSPSSTSEVEVYLSPPAPTSTLPDVNTASMSANTVTASALATDAVAEIVAAVFARAYDATKMGGLTFEELTGLAFSVLLAKASGLPTAPVFRNIGDTANAVSATTDSTGNRSAVTLTAASVR